MFPSAKELKLKSRHKIDYPGHPDYDKFRYSFSEDEFNEFCYRLCFEQRNKCRDIDGKRLMKDKNNETYVHSEDILSASMPDIN